MNYVRRMTGQSPHITVEITAANKQNNTDTVNLISFVANMI